WDRAAHWPVAAPVMVFGAPSSFGADAFPEQAIEPCRSLPANTKSPVVPVTDTAPRIWLSRTCTLVASAAVKPPCIEVPAPTRRAPPGCTDRAPLTTAPSRQSTSPSTTTRLPFTRSVRVSVQVRLSPERVTLYRNRLAAELR